MLSRDSVGCLRSAGWLHRWPHMGSAARVQSAAVARHTRRPSWMLGQLPLPTTLRPRGLSAWCLQQGWTQNEVQAPQSKSSGGGEWRYFWRPASELGSLPPAGFYRLMHVPGQPKFSAGHLTQGCASQVLGASLATPCRHPLCCGWGEPWECFLELQKSTKHWHLFPPSLRRYKTNIFKVYNLISYMCTHCERVPTINESIITSLFYKDAWDTLSKFRSAIVYIRPWVPLLKKRAEALLI